MVNTFCIFCYMIKESSALLTFKLYFAAAYVMMCHSLHLICGCKPCSEFFVSWFSTFKSERFCWPCFSSWPSQVASLSGPARLVLLRGWTQVRTSRILTNCSPHMANFYPGEDSFKWALRKLSQAKKKYLVSRNLLLHLFCPFFCIPAIFLGRSYAVFVLNLPQPLEQCLMLDVVGSLLSQ